MRSLSAPLLFVAMVASPVATATVSDANWTETVFSVNRNTPGDTSGKSHTGLAWAPDGSDRLFVLEKNGRARILSGALTTGSPVWSTFATMSPIVTGGESGLIGIAFDPDFASNHFVYFFVTVSNSEQQIIRYNASTNTGTGRTVVRPGLPTVGGNHNGGGIGFAGDGKLYWAVGDLANGTGVDANLTSLASKVGRANRDGTLPTDNPFDDGGGTNNDFIFARGFRNPFTMQIQPSTGQIWLNVVGDGWEQVFVVGEGDHGGYNDFENNQTAGFITPKIVYRTGSSQSRTITTAERSGNVATFTTTSAHGLRVGSNVRIAGVANGSFNTPALESDYVASVPTTTTFTVQQLDVNASSSGGTASSLNQGSCLTGGAFYDGTRASVEYRGNFFYGDCTSDRIMRARIDTGTNAVLGVDYWATDISSQVDIAAGPDGALYYTGNSTNNIYRAAFIAAGQGLVVANQNLRIDEGGEVVTTVSLAIAPASDVEVTVARTAGDTDVVVAPGTTLTFTPANWMQPQAVSIAALFDEDTSDDSATVSVESIGLTTIPITTTVLDLGTVPNGIFGDGFEG